MMCGDRTFATYLSDTLDSKTNSFGKRSDEND